MVVLMKNNDVSKSFTPANNEPIDMWYLPLWPLDGTVRPVDLTSATLLNCCCFFDVSAQQKVHEMLQKGWDAEGSPFKGQQFDPSMFDIPPSAVQF